MRLKHQKWISSQFCVLEGVAKVPSDQASAEALPGLLTAV